jgi:hypothetical protein
MTMLSSSLNFQTFDQFLRPDIRRERNRVADSRWADVLFCVAIIAVGAGIYGAVMGCWCAPLQAVYVAIKLPLLIVLTTVGNALLNGMLAPLLGLNLPLRHSFILVLMSFAFASAALGGLSPVALFVVWNTPSLHQGTWLSSPEYGALQLTHASFIALAGIIGNLRLLPLLRQFADRASVARNVLFSWLAGNLFLGSQLCWVMRPFIWDPAHATVFIGREYFRGSFYETVFEAARRIIFN